MELLLASLALFSQSLASGTVSTKEAVCLLMLAHFVAIKKVIPQKLLASFKQ